MSCVDAGLVRDQAPDKAAPIPINNMIPPTIPSIMEIKAPLPAISADLGFSSFQINQRMIPIMGIRNPNMQYPRPPLSLDKDPCCTPQLGQMTA